MTFADALVVAAQALWRNLLRTVLATIGIAVGVAVVITIVALGQGARMTVEEQVMAAGTNLIIVQASKGQSTVGDDQDDVVLAFYTSVQKKLMGVDYLRDISVSAASPEGIRDVAEAIRVVLRARHGIRPGAPDDFRVRTLDDIVALRTRTTRTLTWLMVATAAVALLVGGIGVMNIMLVSATERLRSPDASDDTGAAYRVAASQGGNRR